MSIDEAPRSLMILQSSQEFPIARDNVLRFHDVTCFSHSNIKITLVIGTSPKQA